MNSMIRKRVKALAVLAVVLLALWFAKTPARFGINDIAAAVSTIVLV